MVERGEAGAGALTGPDAAADAVTREFLLRFFEVTSTIDFAAACFWWLTDGEYAPVTLLANCNDLFFWACADCERVTPGNIEILAQSLADIQAFHEAWRNSIRNGNGTEAPYVACDIGILLFCCRVRGMRPQGAYYDAFSPGVAELFDAAGPVRCDKDGTPRRLWSAKVGRSLPTTEGPPWKCRACVERGAP